MKIKNRRLGLVVLLSSAALALTACGGGTEASSDSSSPAATAASSSAAAESGVKEVTDMAGDTVSIQMPAESIVATDNRIFRTLDEWDVELSAAPVPLMDGDVLSYPSAEGIVDLGSHREPNMEGFVEAEPDLVLNGQRFSDVKGDISGLIPEDAALVDTNVQEGEPLDGELRELTTLLGDIFGKQSEAEAMVADFDAAIERAQGAYDSEETVVGLIASGGDLSYAAPSTGRAIGPVFDMLNLTPALERDGSSNHQGDDISVEAIAEANPDWLLVMDRDAATAGRNGEEFSPAAELIEGSEALKDVTAVKEGNIVYLPENFYVMEDIQNYTGFLGDLADAFDGQ